MADRAPLHQVEFGSITAALNYLPLPYTLVGGASRPLAWLKGLRHLARRPRYSERNSCLHFRLAG